METARIPRFLTHPGGNGQAVLRLGPAARELAAVPRVRREHDSLRRRLARWLAHLGLRCFMLLYAAAFRVTGWHVLGGKVKRSSAGAKFGRGVRRPGPDGFTILLTGTFYAENWVRSHLAPLAASKSCARALVVSTSPVPSMKNVEAVYPPAWLVRTLGAVPARLLTFGWTALRRRPQLVGGFHLLLNGLAAGLIARVLGARSIYFCVGGPMEVLDGGIHAENRLFAKMETPDPAVERRLIQAVGGFDLVITMGTRAVRFFRQRGIDAPFHVLPGGIDPDRFQAAAAAPAADLIFVGRLAPVKRIDLFLQTVQCVARELPEVRVLIVGDGPLRAFAQELAGSLGIERNVTFLGHRADVENYLRTAKLFVLTSDTEGLALSLMEAMTCGLPAVVSDVGDLGDLVEHGVSGYLVRQRDPQAFAEPILQLLRDENLRSRFSSAARAASVDIGLSAAARKWDEVLASGPRAAHSSRNVWQRI